MSYAEAERQLATVVPARRGTVAAIGVDATARSYDLTALKLGGDAFNKSDQSVFVTLQNDGANPVYYLLDSQNGTVDLDNTGVIAAGGTLALTNTHAAVLPSGQSVRLLIKRNVDKFLVLKCAAALASTIRLFASSTSTPIAQ